MYQNLTEDEKSRKNTKYLIPLQKMVSLLVSAILYPLKLVLRTYHFLIWKVLIFFPIDFKIFVALIHQLKCQVMWAPTQKLEVI